MSSSKTARTGQDELEIAGGFKGEAIEVVKCENSDILVPANVEMIIEGEIPLWTTLSQKVLLEKCMVIWARPHEEHVLYEHQNNYTSR